MHGQLDLTPEGTREVIDQEIPGIAEAVRQQGIAAGEALSRVVPQFAAKPLQRAQTARFPVADFPHIAERAVAGRRQQFVSRRRRFRAITLDRLGRMPLGGRV